jgi:hypothetical protein
MKLLPLVMNRWCLPPPAFAERHQVKEREEAYPVPWLLLKVCRRRSMDRE